MKGWQLVVTSVLVMALFTGAMPSLAWSQGRGQGFRPCPYEPYKCPAVGVCKPMTITGKVSRVYTETLQDNMYPGMAVLIDTKDKGQVRVHLGPVWYLERQEFRLTPGQEVQVQGICLDEKGKKRLIASQVTVGNSVLLLRDREGRPMWEAWRKR